MKNGPDVLDYWLFIDQIYLILTNIPILKGSRVYQRDGSGEDPRMGLPTGGWVEERLVVSFCCALFLCKGYLLINGWVFFNLVLNI